MKIQESAENYLETILMQQNIRGQIRSIDICNALGFSKPTVSVVMKNFREEGLILVDDSGYISLTEKGRLIAEKIYERHEIIAQFLMSLGVDKETAYKDSCKMEHDISDLSLECIKKYYLSKQNNN